MVDFLAEVEDNWNDKQSVLSIPTDEISIFSTEVNNKNKVNRNFLIGCHYSLESFGTFSPNVFCSLVQRTY